MTSSNYRPEQRQVSCTMYTRAGWIRGTFHVPVRMALLDFLNHKESAYASLTDVAIRGHSVKFMAFQKRSMFLMAPPPGDQISKTRVTHSQISFREVVFLTEIGVLQGTMELLGGVRVSDHLHRNRGFLVIQNATARFGAGTPEDTKQFHALILNTEHVIGVSDQTKE